MKFFTFPDPALPYFQCNMALTLGLKWFELGLYPWVLKIHTNAMIHMQVIVWNATFQNCAVWKTQNCQPSFSHSLSLSWPLLFHLQSLDSSFLQPRFTHLSHLVSNPCLALIPLTPDFWTHKPRSSLPLPSPRPHEACCVRQQAIIQWPLSTQRRPTND